MIPNPFTLAAALSSALLLTGCATTLPAPVEPTRNISGSCQPVFGSQICSWGQMSGAKVVATGVTVPMAALEQTPSNVPMVWPPAADAVVAMPAEIQQATGVDVFTFYWEEHGHPPAPFMTPHFDFHFYTVSDAARKAIDCSNKLKPAMLTAGYVLPDEEIPGIGVLTGVCIPAMGMHSLETVSVQGTTPFHSTMVLGYYDGKPIFFEPMIAKAALLERKSFSLPLPTPAGVPAGTHFPTRFEAVYDASIPGYRFVFSGFPD